MIKEVGRENKAKLFRINSSLNTPWKNILINNFLKISSLQAKKYIYKILWNFEGKGCKSII